MNTIIVYATYTGSTELVALDIASVLKEHKHAVSLKKAQEVTEQDLHDHQVVLMGSTSWDLQGNAGFPHNAMFTLIDKTLAEADFTDKQFACFGCGDTDFVNFTGAVDHLEDFVKDKNGQLTHESLRINKFWVDMEKSHQQAKDWAKTVAKKLSS